jgi:hypothetical protein
MNTRPNLAPRFLMLFALFVPLFFAGVSAPARAAQGDAEAQDKANLVGWERDSDYNKLYDMETFSKIKASMVELVEVAPLPGMALGMGVLVEVIEPAEGLTEGDKLVAHFGPKGHVRFLPYVSKAGDKLTLRGSLVEIDGQKVLMASKIKVNEIFEFKVRRTSDGTPYWTLTAQELIDEKMED